MKVFILWDEKKDYFYMKQNELKFYLYTDISLCAKPKNCEFRAADVEMNEVLTLLFNEGFSSGYIDNKDKEIQNEDILFYSKEPNDLFYHQFLLTKDKQWLQKIKKKQLYALCKISQNDVLFATVQDKYTQNIYVLTFTKKDYISEELLENYDGFEMVTYPLNSSYVINLETPVTAN